MIKKLKPNLLWLSDIHFINHDNLSIKFGDKVFNYVSNLVEYFLNMEITHLVITGDISFSGNYEQFKSLYEILIEPLLTKKNDLRVITVCGNHDTNQDLLFDTKKYQEILNAKGYEKRKSLILDTYLPHKGELTSSNLLLDLNEGYRDFFKQFIYPRFDSLVKSNKVECFHYLESQGLFGVVYDKEYDLIFNVLNSSWFSFRKENIFKNTIETIARSIDKEESFEQILDDLMGISQFGNLVFGTLQYQWDILKDLVDRKRIEESFLITLTHHPFSWMDYKVQFNNNTNNFDKIIDLSDIILSGHQHVKHQAPSVYRGIHHYLESPELLDFKMYFQDEDDFKPSIKKYGFNLLSFNHENSKFSVSQYEPLNFYGNNNFNIFKKSYYVKDVFKNSNFSNKISSRKSIIDRFESLDEVKNFFKTNYDVSFNANNLLSTPKNVHQEFLKQLLGENSIHSICFNEGIICECTRNLCLVTFLGINPLDNKELLLDSFLDKTRTIISQLLNNASKFSLDRIFEIRFLIFDYWLFALNSEETGNGKRKNILGFNTNYARLDRLFTWFRYELFKENNNVTIDSGIDLKNIALTYEIANLETYNSCPDFLKEKQTQNNKYKIVKL